MFAQLYGQDLADDFKMPETIKIIKNKDKNIMIELFKRRNLFPAISEGGGAAAGASPFATTANQLKMGGN